MAIARARSTLGLEIFWNNRARIIVGIVMFYGHS